MPTGESISELFDPLQQIDSTQIAAAIKQRVRNVIRSYNHPTDVLSEPIQNAVDELEDALRSGQILRGEVRVQIDCAAGKIKITDNGRGISSSAIRKMLAPDVTAKADLFRNGRSRGHKGVGLTFLAYGFNFFEVESKTIDEHFKVRIEDARRWVEEDAIKDVPQAHLSRIQLSSSHGTGLSITVQVSAETEPKNLQRSLPNAKFALTVIETQTAAAVFPDGPDAKTPSFDAVLEYRAADSTITTHEISKRYRFPHVDLERGHKVLNLGDYKKNAPIKPPARMLSKYSAVYQFFDTDQIVNLISSKRRRDEESLTDADAESLLRRHKASAYVLVGHSSDYKKMLARSWAVPVNRKIVAPSIRVATDSMISSWQRDLSLSHRGFNVERIWVFVHFVGVEPDLGRKDYPPEILELLMLLEGPLADTIAEDGAPFLIPTTRSGKTIDYELPALRASSRRANAMTDRRTLSNLPDIQYVSVPVEEQDVVAIFNELRGSGVLSCYKPIFFSSSYVYDAYFDYDGKLVPEDLYEIFPGASKPLPQQRREGVAEFKFDAADVILDIAREMKSFGDIRWLVCWSAPSTPKTAAGLTMTFTAIEPGDEEYVGVTHLATLDVAGNQVVHVIALKSFLERLHQQAIEQQP